MQRMTMRRGLCLALVGITALSSVGCVNFAANLIRAIKGDNVKPVYEGFKGKKIAIVCGGESGPSNDETSRMLTRQLEVLIGKNVKDVTVISQHKVEKWLTESGLGEPDYEAIGKGLGADQILAITLTNVTLKDGQTMYKGRADIEVNVYDMAKDGATVFSKDFSDFEYPKLDGPTLMDMKESKFRDLFVSVVSMHIGALFYPHDPNDLKVLDPRSISF